MRWSWRNFSPTRRPWDGTLSAAAWPASLVRTGSRSSRAFSHEAAAAASLGQVHRARLPDGTEVACKLQYPDMPSTVEADLRQLKLAMAVYHSDGQRHSTG